MSLLRLHSAMAAHTAPGDGAVSRTLAECLDDTVNVKSFGATGDGSTDDTAAIQAAIDYLATPHGAADVKGGTVVFPDGLYRVSATINIPILFPTGGAGTANETGASLIRLRGAGHMAILVATSGLDVNPIIQSVPGFTTIERLGFKGLGGDAGGVGIRFGRTDSAAGGAAKNYPGTVTDCRFESLTKAIHVWDFEDVEIARNYFLNCRTAVKVDENGMGTRIVNNTMMGGGPCVSITHASGGQQAEGVVIAHNHMYPRGVDPQTESNGGHGIHMAGAYACKIIGNVIGEVEDPSSGDSYGVYIDGQTYACRFITIMGNWIGGASNSGGSPIGDSGIVLRGNVRDCKVIGNEISTLAGYAISLDGGSVTDTVIAGNSTNLIHTADIALNSSVRTLVSGNTVWGSSVPDQSVPKVAIWEFNNNTKSLVTGNVFSAGAINKSTKSVYRDNFGDDMPLNGTFNQGRVRGVLVHKNSVNQSTTSGTPVNVTWAVADWDTDGCFSTSEPGLIRVPAWARLARVTGAVAFAATTTAGDRIVDITRTGATFSGKSSAVSAGTGGYMDHSPQIATAWVAVSPGDYFEIQATQNSGGSLDILGGVQTWLQVEFA